MQLAACAWMNIESGAQLDNLDTVLIALVCYLDI